MRLSQALESHLSYCHLEKHSTAKWLDWQARTLNAFLAHAQAEAPEHLTPGHLTAYLSTHRRSAAWRHNAAVVIRAFARWIERYLLIPCPLAKALVRPCRPVQRPLPSFDTLTQIVKAITNPEARDAARLLQLTGCRRGELLKTVWRDVDFPRGLLYLPAANTKSGKARAVPLVVEALNILRHRLDAAPQSPGPFTLHPCTLTHAWVRAARQCGCHGVRLHDLRHAYGTRSLNELGADIVSIQSVMGHADIGTTRRYLHPNSDHAETLKRLWDATSR